VSAHDWQVPVQAALQQTPCAQKLELHWALLAQAAAAAFLVQLPPLQVNGATQSVSAVQVVLQAPLPQTYGSHADVVTVWQVPVPLHVRAGVSVEPVQEAGAQVVPVAYKRQAPAPLQKLSVPHDAAPWSEHWASGSWPAGTLVHAPADPVSAHDWQVPVQAVEQQTPCWQKPLPQSLPALQAAPIGFLVQAPPTQTLGATQSASAVHAVLHAAVPHT
jgi:hypothetical protein